uniref:PTTG1IP family member 2 n=1 Tax=Nannospalax galili TaxID=1026970 RepID=A0A8C6QXE8_NANGA
MCWLRAWSQILLPIFLSLVFIQLFVSFSDNKITKIHHHKKQQIEAKSLEEECAQKTTCPSCTQDKRCIWCREEGICKKYCFPYANCQFNSIFWANCRVDLFGIVMLILVAVILVGFLWYCIAFYFYMYEREAIYYPRGGQFPVYNWSAA